MGDIKTVPRGF